MRLFGAGSWLTASSKQNAKPRRARGGPRRATTLRLEPLESRQLMTVTLSQPLNIVEPAGKDVLVPLTAGDSGNQPITYQFQSSSPNVTLSLVSPTSQSLRLTVSGTDKSGNAFTGVMILHLFEDLAPLNTARIKQLVGQSFYNGTTFGRVLDGFVSQAGFSNTGAPLNTGNPIQDEFSRGLAFTGPGLLAMANAGPDTNDAEFFITAVNAKASNNPITLADMPQTLNYKYTIFGQLVSGAEIFNKMMQVNVTTNPPLGGEASKPISPITITSADLITDTQNAVLRVSAPVSAAGTTATVTVTATGGGGATNQKTFTVNVQADTVSDPPFLGTVPASLSTPTNLPATFTLTSTDVDNTGVAYTVVDRATFAAPANVDVSINQASGQVTLTPKAGFTGTVNLLAGVRKSSAPDAKANYDTQALSLTVTTSTTATLSLPNLSGKQGETVVVPITISNPHPAGTSGLATANIGVTYNPAIFDVTTADIQKGSLTGSGWTLTPTINTTTGQILINLVAASGQQLTGTAAGTLAVINFKIKSGAALGATPIKIAGSVSPNGTTVSTAFTDSNNAALTISPAPTNESNNPVVGNVNVQALATSPTAPVNLASSFNQVGSTAKGAKFRGGLDGDGQALNGSLMGATQVIDGLTFNLGGMGANNIIAATGQVINLAAGQFSRLALLATSVYGSQLNQVFTVKYSDGTSSTLTQNLSDWLQPKTFSGESIGISAGPWNTAGRRSKHNAFVYRYDITLDSTKTVSSITLPNNPNVKILAMTEVGVANAPTGLSATAAAGGINLAWTAPGGTVTGYNVYRGTAAGGESSTPLNSAPLAGSATSFTDATAVAGNKYFYTVKSINNGAVSSASNEANATATNTATSAIVDLSTAFNLVGITARGARFSGGLDGAGQALNGSVLGVSQTIESVNYKIGAVGANNVVTSTGQTISLPPGQFARLSLLATSVYGNQANQVFTVKYTDNTTATLTQTMSDWLEPKGFSGESIGVSTGSWNVSGRRSSHNAFVYRYNLTLDASKTVSSITLPNNVNVKVLAMTLVK